MGLFWFNVKLKYLDKYNQSRQQSAHLYNQAFEKVDKIQTPFVESDIDSHVYHQYTLKVPSEFRDSLAELLGKNLPSEAFDLSYKIYLFLS